MTDISTLGKFKIGTVVKFRGSDDDLGHVIGFTKIKIWKRVASKSYNMELHFKVVV
jgi:hypothetical protein